MSLDLDKHISLKGLSCELWDRKVLCLTKLWSHHLQYLILMLESYTIPNVNEYSILREIETLSESFQLGWEWEIIIVAGWGENLAHKLGCGWRAFNMITMFKIVEKTTTKIKIFVNNRLHGKKASQHVLVLWWTLHLRHSIISSKKISISIISWYYIAPILIMGLCDFFYPLFSW